MEGPVEVHRYLGKEVDRAEGHTYRVNAKGEGREAEHTAAGFDEREEAQMVEHIPHFYEKEAVQGAVHIPPVVANVVEVVLAGEHSSPLGVKAADLEEEHNVD